VVLTLIAHAWQSWKHARSVAFLVVLALTAGIGSVTTVYTVVDSMLLRPVPFERGDRFVSVLGADASDPNGMSGLSLNDAEQIEKRARSFDLFGCMQYADHNLTSAGQPLHVQAAAVNPGLANGLGVAPYRGHWFRDAKDTSAVLSYRLWTRLGGDTGILGKSVTLSGKLYTVAGVMPDGFNLPLAGPYSEAQIELWLPLDPYAKEKDRNAGTTFCYGRRRPGVNLAEAGTEARRIAADIARQAPDTQQSFSIRVDDLHQLANREIRPVLVLLFGAAGILLLITCANVAGLLLVRSLARERETAVRVAFGARIPQLVRQYFLEGLLVSVPGALGGLVLSALILRILLAYAAEHSARIAQIALDWRSVAFAAAAALLAAALTSIAPMWQAARTMPNEALGEGVRSSTGARSRRLSRSLVISEVSLAFVLLALSTILVAELYRLTRVTPGFDPDHLLAFELTLQPHAEPDHLASAAYQKRLVEALESIPGVAGAGFANQLPLDGCCFSTSIYVYGAPEKVNRGERVAFLPVNPGYFRTMRIPLRAGRFLTSRDGGDKPPLTVVIDQATASRYWPKQEAVGKFGRLGHAHGDPFQVVGVVGDVKNNGLDNPTVPEIYLLSDVAPPNPMKFVVRSSLPPASLIAAVRAAIQRENPEQPIHAVRMMSEVVSESMGLKRAASYVMTFFAISALLMAAIGAYGVVSYSVQQRTVEFGTRMALGATGRDLLKLVLGGGLRMAGYGIAIGIAASVAVTWFLVRQFEIAVGNGGVGRLENPGILPFVVSTLVVTAAAMASSWFPAWSATLVSPMVAIRNQPESMWRTAGERLRTFFQDLSRGTSAQTALAPEGTLMTELIDASRRAGSFREALHVALKSLCASISARSGLLLESVSDEEFRTAVAWPKDSGAACLLPKHGLLLNRLRFYAAPLPIADGDLDAWSRWVAQNRPESIGEVEAIRGAEVRLAVPLRTSKEMLGVLLLGPPSKDEGYTPADKVLIRGCADHFALMLENARLTDRVVEQEKLRRDVALAAEVQRRLLAEQSLDTPAASLAALNLPARSVGGDYYDFLKLDGDRIGIALADVAGKGVPAALIMSVVQATLRVISSEPEVSLPQLAARMNHFLYRSTGSNSYATFFYAEFDARTRELRYVNAGHNPPYLLRVGGDSPIVEELPAGGTVIGLFPQAEYEESSVALKSGDLLAVFTDGVPEALNPKDEEFGEDRLKSLLGRIVHLPVEAISARLADEMRNWIQDAAQYDDLTFVLLKVK
jgi:predicted permease